MPKPSANLKLARELVTRLTIDEKADLIADMIVRGGVYMLLTPALRKVKAAENPDVYPVFERWVLERAREVERMRVA